MESDTSLLLDLFHQKRKEQNNILDKKIKELNNCLNKVNLREISKKLSYVSATTEEEIDIASEYFPEEEWIRPEITKRVKLFVRYLNKTYKYLKFCFTVKEHDKKIYWVIKFISCHPLMVYMSETLDASLSPLVPIILEYYE